MKVFFFRIGKAEIFFVWLCWLGSVFSVNFYFNFVVGSGVVEPAYLNISEIFLLIETVFYIKKFVHFRRLQLVMLAFVVNSLPVDLLVPTWLLLLFIKLIQFSFLFILFFFSLAGLSLGFSDILIMFLSDLWSRISVFFHSIEHGC